MNPFGLEAKLIAGGVLLLALLGALWGFIHHERTLGAAEVTAAATAQALAATQENLRESNRRTAAIESTAHDADQAASAARSDADAARSSGERLRERIAALNRSAADHPAAAASGPASISADTVPADLLASVVYSAGRYAAIADEARIAGQACEQSYRQLTP